MTESDAVRAACNALGWERLYRVQPGEARYSFLPELDHLDPDFACALADFCPPTGALLEVGAGSGRQAVEYARLGYRMTATEVSATCVAAVQRAAITAGVAVDCREDDITRTALLPGFAIICDRGCLTLIEPGLIPGYVASLGRLLDPAGIFLVKVDRRRPLPDDFAGLTLLRRHEGTYGGSFSATPGETVPSIMYAFRRAG